MKKRDNVNLIFMALVIALAVDIVLVIYYPIVLLIECGVCFLSLALTIIYLAVDNFFDKYINH